MSTPRLICPYTFLGRVAEAVGTVHPADFRREILIAAGTLGQLYDAPNSLWKRGLRAVRGNGRHRRGLGTEFCEGSR